jgi:hypothetical protein
MSVEGRDGFDQRLEQQLRRHASAHIGPSPMPAQARYHASYLLSGLRMSVFAKAAALVSTKAAVGLIVAAAAVSAVGSGEAVITGSVNPADWGSQLVQQAQTCTAALMPVKHGIGECASTFAPRQSKGVSDEHRASAAREHGLVHTPVPPNGHPTGKQTSHPTGKPTGGPAGPSVTHSTGEPSSHPTGKPNGGHAGSPAVHPTGKPSSSPGGVPAGPPASHPRKP